MSDVFVGIVEGQDSGSLSVGLIGDDRWTTARTVMLEPASVRDYYPPRPEGGRSFLFTPGLATLGQFLREAIPRDATTRFLVEVPETVPHPPDHWGAIPHPVLPADSRILQVVILLGVLELVAAPLKLDPAEKTAVLFPILRESELSHLRSKAPRYVGSGTCRAFAQLHELDGEHSDHLAIVGAMIAKNPGAFHFWSSIGRVQSSQDVFNDLRQGLGVTSVLSAAEYYELEITAGTRRTDLEDVLLEYALAESDFAYLGPNGAIKAALIRVAQRWGIVLRCRSHRDDADDETSGVVQPLPMFESFLMAAMAQAEREGRSFLTPPNQG